MDTQDLKVAIVGDRNFLDYEYFSKIIDLYREKYGISFIYSGGANGTDSLAERYAKEHQISYTVFMAEWSKYGKRAGPRRNLKVVECCDIMIAFLAEHSKGTRNAIDLANKLGKRVLIINI